VVVLTVTTTVVVVVDVDALELGPLDDPTELAADRGELDVHAAAMTEATMTPMPTTDRHFTMRFLLAAGSRTGYGLVPTPPCTCRYSREDTRHHPGSVFRL
jgi:hypothetical protein